MTTFAMIGSGWRARYFLRLAEALPDLRCSGLVTRHPEAAGDLGLAMFGAVDALLADHRPDFVVVAVTWDANPDAVRAVVAHAVPLLCETPPAPDLAGLRRLWADVGASGLVQVAEQYLLVPAHAARRAVLGTGAIGQVSQVQVSSTHAYHAVALMRGLLGLGAGQRNAGSDDGSGSGFGPVTVRATRTVAPLVDPLTRAGWTDDAEPHDATTTIATLDFGDGRSGLYDFTDNQWHNQLRHRRIVVRGTHGELADDDVVRLLEPHTIVRTPLVRRQTGYDLDLDGFDTDHICFGDHIAFRNPFLGRRWSDEDIAMATMLTRTAAWCKGSGPEPYPLAQACQDHAVALAIEAAADTDTTVTTAVEPWATVGASAS